MRKQLAITCLLLFVGNACSNDEIQLSPHSLVSERELQFSAKQDCTHSLVLYINERDSGTQVISNNGYVVEGADTEGRKIFSDWQTTVGGEHSTREWSYYPKVSKWRGRTSAIELYPASSASVDGLSFIRGYVVRKVSGKIKTVSLDRPKEVVGRLLVSPELRAMKIYIKELEGDKLIVLHSRAYERFFRLKGIDVLDSKDQTIDWEPVSVAGGKPVENGEFLEHVLKLNSPFPSDGKLVVNLFDDVQEVRVPFEYKDLFFEEIRGPSPRANSTAREISQQQSTHGFELMPKSLLSRRILNISRKADQKEFIQRSHDLRLTLTLRSPPGLTVVSETGWVIDTASTNRGEILKAKVQPSHFAEIPIWNWEVNEQELISVLDLKVNLVGAIAPVEALAHVKGYCNIKYGKATKVLEIQNPLKSIGKRIDAPAELKQLGLYIGAIEGQSITLCHSSAASKFVRLSALRVTDGSGKDIPWACDDGRTPTEDGHYLMFDLKLEREFPPDGRLLFTVYDELFEEKVPFEIKGACFENSTAIKPPPPPPDF